MFYRDETLPTINKPKHPKKKRNIQNKMEGTSKKTKDPPKNHVKGQTTKGTSSSRTPSCHKKLIK